MSLPPMLGGDENYWDEPDFLLSYVVTALVNGMGLELGVTLMLRGLVVSGTLVSEDRYLEHLTTVLQEQIDFSEGTVPPEAREALQEVLDVRTMREFEPETFFAVDDEDETDDADFLAGIAPPQFNEMPAPLQHLHLKSPVIIAGEPPMRFDDGVEVILRLRMTAVDGWMVGRISQEPPPDFLDFDDGGIAH